MIISFFPPLLSLGKGDRSGVNKRLNPQVSFASQVCDMPGVKCQDGKCHEQRMFPAAVGATVLFHPWVGCFLSPQFLHDPIVASIFSTTLASPLLSLSIFAEEILRSWRHKKLEECAQPIRSKFPGFTFHSVMSSSASKLLTSHSGLSHKAMRLYSFLLNLNPLLLHLTPPIPPSTTLLAIYPKGEPSPDFQCTHISNTAPGPQNSIASSVTSCGTLSHLTSYFHSSSGCLGLSLLHFFSPGRHERTAELPCLTLCPSESEMSEIFPFPIWEMGTSGWSLSRWIWKFQMLLPLEIKEGTWEYPILMRKWGWPYGWGWGGWETLT